MQRCFRKAVPIALRYLVPKVLRQRFQHWDHWHRVATSKKPIIRYENTRQKRIRWVLQKDDQDLAAIEGYYSGATSFYIELIENIAKDGRGMSYFPPLLQALEHDMQDRVAYVTVLVIAGMHKALLERYGFQKSAGDIKDSLNFLGTEIRGGKLIPMEKQTSNIVHRSSL